MLKTSLVFIGIALAALLFAGAIWLLRRDYVDELTTVMLGGRSGNHSS